MKTAGFYHLASSGGTTLSRLLLARFKIILLSEVHPFHLQVGTFSPAHPLELAAGQIEISAKALRSSFLSQLRRVERSTPRDFRLLLRVHSHSDYFGEPRPHSDEVLNRVISNAAVTVREPFAHYISGLRRGFFTGVTLSDFLDRVDRFLDRYQSLPLFRLEESLMDPHSFLAAAGQVLQLGERPSPLDYSQLPAITGDARRPVPVVGEAFHEMMSANWAVMMSEEGAREALISHSDRIVALRRRMGYSDNLENPL